LKNDFWTVGASTPGSQSGFPLNFVSLQSFDPCLVGCQDFSCLWKSANSSHIFLQALPIFWLTWGQEICNQNFG
jgi:hypothetical protein